MEDLIWLPDVRKLQPSKELTRRVRSLPLEAGVQYGILGPGYSATALASEILGVPADAGLEIFAKHILMNCGGLRVVEAAQQMALDRSITGQAVTGDSLARYLTNQGFFIAEHNTAINTLRMWLAEVGVFSEKGWDVNPKRKSKLLGLDDSDISLLVGMSDETKEFALALCRLAPKGKMLAANVRDNAETAGGIRLSRQSLPKIMQPLKDAGYIDFMSGGTSGGKSAQVWTTPKFTSFEYAPLM